MSYKKSSIINHYYKIIFTLAATGEEVERYVVGYPFEKEYLLRSRIKKFVMDMDATKHFKAFFKIEKWHGSSSPGEKYDDKILDLNSSKPIIKAAA